MNAKQNETKVTAPTGDGGWRPPAANAKQPVFLSSGGFDAKPAVTLGQGFPTEVNTLPASYFWRKSLCDGEYRHPVAGWELSVTPEYRKKLVDTFKRTTESGLQFPIQRKHDGMGLGFLLDVKNEDGWLWELHQYLGDDARIEALRNRVSIGIHPNVPDARKGKQWGEGIFHSAIVPDPVVSGQGEAIRVMSAQGQPDMIDVLTLAEGVATMSAYTYTQEQFNGLKAALGGGDDLTPDTLFAKLSERLSTTQTTETKLASLTSEIDQTKAALATAETKIKEFSASAPKQPDPDLIRDRGTLAIDEIKLLSESGHITPACADALGKVLVNDNAFNVRLLSSESGSPPAYKGIVAALKMNRAMEFGRMSGVQVLNQPGETSVMSDEEFQKMQDDRLARIGLKK